MNRIILTLLFISFINLGYIHDLPTYDIAKPSLTANDFIVKVLVDSSCSMDIDTISKLHKLFKPAKSRYTTKSIRNTYWFAFELTNSSSHKVKRIVGFDEVFLETVDIYYKSGSEWHSKQSGLSVSMNKREIKNRCPLFYVTLNPNETKIIYLKAYSEFALIMGVVVDSTDVFLQKEQKITMWYWAYFGAAIAILMYNLFLLLYIREKVYLYYVIYAVCFIVFIFVYSGYFQYLTSSVKVLYGLDASIATMGAFITLFTRELLKTRQISFWIDKVLVAISTIYAVIAILIIVDIYFYQWLVIISMPFMLFLLFTGIFCMVKKVQFAKYYVAAMGFYLVGLVMIAAVNSGIIPYNSITRYGFMIGSLIELIMFSMALGYRIKYLQDEKTIIQEKLLVSERDQNKRLEKQVKERTKELTSMNDRLRQLSKFKEDMTGMIIHDLKNPLSAIVNARTIKNETDKLNTIEQSSHKMLNLVQNILDVFKSENSQFELNKTTIIIDKIIKNALNEVVHLVEQKSINVIINNGTNCKIEADGNIIMRVFINILSNAIKASPNNSIINIKYTYEEGEVKIDISNQGIGIPESEQKIIFEKFKQLKNDQNKEYSSGLGLAFCKMAIEAHDGKIGVVSKGSIGVTFWFTIPNAIRLQNNEVNFDAGKEAMVLLSKADREYLIPFVQKLEQYETFDVWEINNVLDKIGKQNEGVVKWLNKLDDTIYSGNNKAFKELLKL